MKQSELKATELSLSTALLVVIVIGICSLLIMTSMAYGFSGLGFGVVFVICAYALIVNRYRFGLRTFLVVTTMLTVWLGFKIGRDSRLQQAIEKATNAGGQLKLHDRSPDFPWGLWTNRYDLSFYGLSKPLSAAAFDHFIAFAPSTLHELDLDNTGITDDSLKSVGLLSGLEYLSLANETYFSGGIIPDKPQNHITDAGLLNITRLTQLIRIQLGGTDITDEGLKCLAGMRRLRCMYLEGTKINGTGLSNLRFLNDLMSLELNGCRISSDGYAQLANIPTLTSIGLNGSGTTDTDLDRLSALPDLSIVRLVGDPISEGAVKRFWVAHPDCRIER